jgi:glucose-6-phosphate isomerase
MLEVESGKTLGDYLFGYLEGSRNALYDRGRDSIAIAVRDLSPTSLGELIALYERAVGLYAELINVNAYNQPGVDKEAAAGVVQLQGNVLAYLSKFEEPRTAGEIAAGLDCVHQIETVYKILVRLAIDPRRGVVGWPGTTPFDHRFSVQDRRLGLDNPARPLAGSSNMSSS